MADGRPDLPTGTVTFLFTDIEGSTRLVQRLGANYRAVLEDHHRLLRSAIRDAGGLDLRTEGDAFFAVFASAGAAVAAAVAGQRALGAHGWPEGVAVRVRMGLHTGEAVRGGDDYVGLAVHLAARIAAAAHGGQVLVSNATRSLVQGERGSPAELRNLGEHRLKDFPDPVRLFQLSVDGGQDFPPPRTLGGPSVLSGPATSFVGRAAELQAVRERVGSSRLVTLTGPGGTGKTRLAVEAARGLVSAFRDGVVFVDLSALTDARLVPPAIAAAIGLRSLEGPPIEAVVEHLRPREMLLVLDNVEQVLQAAGDVARLLAEAPAVKVLATSRSPLSIVGEQEFPVPPMPVVAPRAGSESDAVALFAARATAVDPAFSLDGSLAAIVAEICARSARPWPGATTSWPSRGRPLPAAARVRRWLEARRRGGGREPRPGAGRQPGGPRGPWNAPTRRAGVSRPPSVTRPPRARRCSAWPSPRQCARTQRPGTISWPGAANATRPRTTRSGSAGSSWRMRSSAHGRGSTRPSSAVSRVRPRGCSCGAVTASAGWRPCRGWR